MRATHALVHLDRFRENIRAVRERIGAERRICVPVKADAYGHGALPLALAALEAGADCLAVAFVQEGGELRQGGIGAPILLLSQSLPAELGDLVRWGLSPLVSDGAYVDALAAIEGDLTVHLKVDTGMGRAGCRPEEAVELAGRIVSRRGLRLGGVATHLAVADSLLPPDIAYTNEQLGRFQAAVAAIRDAGIDPGIVHAANTGGVLYHPGSWFDMVRPGILLYGYPPAGALPLKVRPVMELRSNVVAIKKLQKGDSVSYGRTWIAPEDTLVAIVPVGYGDGFRRGLSNNWQVGIRGNQYPVVGRICMDQCMVSLGSPAPGTPVAPGDDVIVFGEADDGSAPGTAADMAERLDTIPYEITCGISKRVPRVYI
jgi:alanine racemase